MFNNVSRDELDRKLEMIDTKLADLQRGQAQLIRFRQDFFQAVKLIDKFKDDLEYTADFKQRAGLPKELRNQGMMLVALKIKVEALQSKLLTDFNLDITKD